MVDMIFYPNDNFDRNIFLLKEKFLFLFVSENPNDFYPYIHNNENDLHRSSRHVDHSQHKDIFVLLIVHHDLK